MNANPAGPKKSLFTPASKSKASPETAPATTSKLVAAAEPVVKRLEKVADPVKQEKKGKRVFIESIIPPSVIKCKPGQTLIDFYRSNLGAVTVSANAPVRREYQLKR